MLIIILICVGLIIFLNWLCFKFLAVIPLDVFDFFANLGWWFLLILIVGFLAWCFDEK